MSQATDVVVISQLPPPIHGSTLMTKTFVSTIDSLDLSWSIVDRRFSTSVSDVGRFSLRKVLSALLMPLRLAWVLWRERPRVVVFFVTNRSFSFIVDCVLCVVLRIFRQSTVRYVHTAGYRGLAQKGRIWNGLVSLLLGGAGDVVVLGPSLVPDVAPWVSSDRVRLVPNAVSDAIDPQPIFSSQQTHQESKQSVLFMSNLIPEKGADTFVELAIKLANSFPETEFLIAGADVSSEFSNRLRFRIHQANLEDQIKFLGLVSLAEEKWRLLRSSSLLVFPSRYPFEAQPLTILEAMSQGTPVVSFAIGGISDVILEDVSGYLAPPGDVEQMERVISGALRDRDKLEHLRESTARHFEQNFSLDAYRSKWASVLKLGERTTYGKGTSQCS